MAFELKQVVPWGRSMDEYIAMFRLTPEDLQKKIAGFGDGPACFNAEMNDLQHRVISFDPIYGFSKLEIEQRISETSDIIIEQIATNQDKFVWNAIKSVVELVAIRMSAMKRFLEDYETGIGEGRYQHHCLPDKTNYHNDHFELGLSSHFLILYDTLGLNFHIQSITEMLRVCKEVRIFPLVNLDASESEVLQGIIAHFSLSFSAEISPVAYVFQKGGDKMLVIKHLSL